MRQQKNFQKIINNMFSHGCFPFYLSVPPFFFHSRDETSCYPNGNVDGRIFLEMLSMHYDESTATCRLHVELSCRLHASSDNLWHSEDQKILHTWKSKRAK